MMELMNLYGVVVDAETNEPIQGVTIEKLAGGQPTGLYTMTDAAGLFNIPILGYNGLAFSHVSYQPETYLDVNLSTGKNIIKLLRKETILPGITITAGKSSYWWLLLAAAVGYYGYKKKWF